MQLLIFVLALLLFISLILVHEWGHFFMARRNGVDVEEFGLGFPPRIWSRKVKSGMRLSLNVLPLGGFVKLKGEHDSDERKGSLGAASLGTKAKVMLAGVTMNLIAGLVLLTALALIGMPKLITKDNTGQDQYTVASDTRIIRQGVLAGAVIKDTPAAKLGLKSSDSIVSIAGPVKTFQIHTIQQLHDATVALAGQPVTVSYTRGGSGQVISKPTRLLGLDDIVADLKSQAKIPQAAQIKRVTDVSFTDKNNRHPVNDVSSPNDFYTAALEDYGDNVRVDYLYNGQAHSATAQLNPKAYLGISPTQVQIQRSSWSAPIVALGLSKQITVLTFQGLGHALSGLGSTIAGLATGNHQARENGQQSASAQVGGPVAIGVALWDSGSLGFNFMLLLIALISLTLAIMNILPIPALDGGRLAMMLISRGVFRRPLSRPAEERIVGASFALLMALVVLITVVDVKRFF
jgi:membrane-associated protease RseP (regulator of RpoE activity)